MAQTTNLQTSVRRIDAILFDWDGVLFNSMEAIGQAVVEVCKEFGIRIEYDYYLNNFSQPWWDFYQQLGIPATAEDERKKLYDKFHACATDRVKICDLYPESAEVLRKLYGKVKMGIVSAGKVEPIRNLLYKHDLGSVFDPDHIVGMAHDKVEAIAEFYKRNQLHPQSVLMVGDLPSDLQDGLAAGVQVAGVARYERAKQRLSEYGPHYLIDHLEQLLDLVSHE